MPRRPPKACTQPGCSAYAQPGRATCVQHTKAKRAWPERGTTTERGYGYRWQQIRSMILRRDPVCTICQARPAVEVDHIVAKAFGGGDEDANLRGVCRGCHKAKTAWDSASSRAAPSTAPKGSRAPKR